MSQTLHILGEGRKVIKKSVDEFAPDQTVSTIEYDDGTIVTMTVTDGDIKIACNKQLDIQPDGQTAKMIE
ncbi:hypothetical protein [Domibacillus robiginosus]|uniref:hypothetical protein n=1 Tax=Domibacillus robiginosus TaxID=1071054 RepID=UPI00067D6926|nr:hypothetical protein [Domibacillus robiginosus]